MSDEEIDHEYTNNMVCPYCGFEDYSSWELSRNDDSSDETECNECGKKFFWECVTSVHYTTKKLEDMK